MEALLQQIAAYLPFVQEGPVVSIIKKTKKTALSGFSVNIRPILKSQP
ncbi:hypothetical protein J7E95_04865 [Streptomyces sp. ISL-14]|nr:hypothetical protein [Streptomyces sp. ISL-14]